MTAPVSSSSSFRHTGHSTTPSTGTLVAAGAARKHSTHFLHTATLSGRQATSVASFRAMCMQTSHSLLSSPFLCCALRRPLSSFLFTIAPYLQVRRRLDTVLWGNAPQGTPPPYPHQC